MSKTSFNGFRLPAFASATSWPGFGKPATSGGFRPRCGCSKRQPDHGYPHIEPYPGLFLKWLDHSHERISSRSAPPQTARTGTVPPICSPFQVPAWAPGAGVPVPIAGVPVPAAGVPVPAAGVPVPAPPAACVPVGIAPVVAAVVAATDGVVAAVPWAAPPAGAVMVWPVAGTCPVG